MSPCQSIREPRAAGRFRAWRSASDRADRGNRRRQERGGRALERAGAVVIDADAVGHELLKDPEVRGQIVERFGAGVLAGAEREPGSPPAIDRKALGAIVFADPAARRDLEAILHPRMRAWFRAVDRARAFAREPEKVAWSCSMRRSCSRPAGTICAI